MSVTNYLEFLLKIGTETGFLREVGGTHDKMNTTRFLAVVILI